MKNLADRHTTDLTHFDAKKSAERIHTAGALEKVAEKLKDRKALHRAIEIKAHEQRQFVRYYKASFPVGRPENVDLSVNINRIEFLKPLGFNEKTISRWKQAYIESLEIEAFDDDAKAVASLERLINKADRTIFSLDAHANTSAKSVEWYTPAAYVDAAITAMGSIDLDPACDDKAYSRKVAEQTYSKRDRDEDGLLLPWFGNVFCNPPYSDEGINFAEVFCLRAIELYGYDDIQQAILLVNLIPASKWQRPLYQHTVCMTDHRIKFIAGDGSQNNNPTYSNLFVYLGQDSQRFAEVFQSIGYVMVPYAT